MRPTRFFSSRRRHTRLQGDWSFRRVLFKALEKASVSTVAAGVSSPREIRGSDLPLLSSGPGLAGRPSIHSELWRPGGRRWFRQPQEWRLPYGEYGKPGELVIGGPIKSLTRAALSPLR